MGMHPAVDLAYGSCGVEQGQQLSRAARFQLRYAFELESSRRALWHCLIPVDLVALS